MSQPRLDLSLACFCTSADAVLGLGQPETPHLLFAKDGMVLRLTKMGLMALGRDHSFRQLRLRFSQERERHPGPRGIDWRTGRTDKVFKVV